MLQSGNKIADLLPFGGRNYAVVGITDGKRCKYGAINRQGEFVIEPIYDRIDFWGTDNDLVCVNIGFRDRGESLIEGKWGVVNLLGETLIPLKYSSIESWADGQTFTVCYRNRWGTINLRGEAVMPLQKMDYMSTPNFKGLILAKVNGKEGYIDLVGRPVIELIYDEITPMFTEHSDDWLAVKKGDECFYIDQTGKRVLL